MIGVLAVGTVEYATESTTTVALLLVVAVAAGTVTVVAIVIVLVVVLKVVLGIPVSIKPDSHDASDDQDAHEEPNVNVEEDTREVKESVLVFCIIIGALF